MANEASSSKQKYILVTGLNFDQTTDGEGHPVPKFYPAGSEWSPPPTRQRWNAVAHTLVDVPMSEAEQAALVQQFLSSGVIRPYGSAPGEVAAQQQSEIERLTRQLEEQQAMIEKLELEELKRKMGVPASLGSGRGAN